MHCREKLYNVLQIYLPTIGKYIFLQYIYFLFPLFIHIKPAFTEHLLVSNKERKAR